MQENLEVTTKSLTIQQQIQDSYTVQYADYLNLEPQLLMYSTNHYWSLYSSLSGFARGKNSICTCEFSLNA